MRALQLIFLYLVAAWIAYVGIRIEVLSNAAGGFPSAKSLAETRAAGGSGKWRAMSMNEERWRSWNIRDSAGNPDPRALTTDEEAEMREEIRSMNANGELRKFVSSYGWLMQYAAVLLVILFGGKWAIRYRRRAGLVLLYLLPVMVAIAGGALAVYRGYFSVIAIGI